jgi:hypothetical protein
MHLIIKFKLVICQMKKPICKILRTNKNNNFKIIIKFLMTLDRSNIGYLGFSIIDFFKNVLMYSKGAICLSRLLFKMGLFTVCTKKKLHYMHTCAEFSRRLKQELNHLNTLHFFHFLRVNFQQFFCSFPS